MNISEQVKSNQISLVNELLMRSPYKLLPVIGSIKTGIRQIVNGKRIPKRLDHFVICTRFKDETGEYIIDKELMEEIARRTGQKPNKLQKIPITFAFDDISLNFQSWFVARFEGRRCVGDGKKAKLILPNGEIKIIQCPCKRLSPDFQEKSGRCSIYSRLFVIIRHSPRIGGVYIYRTRSWNTSRNLICMLHFFKKNTGGILAGLPLNLIIYPERVITPEGKARLVYVVSLEYEGRSDNVLRELVEYGAYIRSLKEKHSGVLEHSGVLKDWEKKEELEEETRVQVSKQIKQIEDGEDFDFKKDINFEDFEKDVLDLEIEDF